MTIGRKPPASEPFTFAVIREDGSCAIHTEHPGTRPLDDVVRAAVGELLEHIPVAFHGLALWCDEEAPMRRRPVNPVASRLAFRVGGRADIYAGPIAVTGLRRHNLTSLSTDQVDLLRGLTLACGGIPIDADQPAPEQPPSK